MSAGFLDEVIALRAHPKGLSRTAAQALGYRELLAHLRGETSLDEALELATNRTRQFARRQRSWFGRDPRIARTEEHTAELQSLMRNTYADFCLKKKNTYKNAK